ncbi:nephrin-like [Dreissena polymorpha]|uniref:nephrin-like n=1 Tax=Dreissena polymorpha TaxID=45954 RepID=UPI0022640956|nr:nephrin-like [Dreissena polymorpha]
MIAYPKPTSQDVVWYKRDDGSWRILSDDTNVLITISDDSMQTQLEIFHVQRADYTEYMVNVSNKLGSTVEVFTLKAQSKPEIPKELQVSKTGQTELTIKWTPGFNGGESQTFTVRYKALGDGSWIVIPINIPHYIWTIDSLISGTTYQIQMMALNKIGKSDWTHEINVTTLLDTGNSGSSTSALGGIVGGIFGVLVAISVFVLILKYRLNGLNTTKQCLANSNSKYEDLVEGQGNSDAPTTDGIYETCRIDSSNARHANQYETLAEFDSREYSTISAYSYQQENTTSTKMSASGQTYEPTKDSEYVNLQLFTH